jgi:hypothetical protein
LTLIVTYLTDETASSLVSPFTPRHNHAHFRPAIGFIPSATADFFSLWHPEIQRGGRVGMDTRRVATAVFSLLLTTTSAWAQQGAAEIRGRVTDQQTASLPGVTVVVTNQDTGNYREAISTGDGTFFMAALPPGKYQVAAQLQGFKRFVRRDIVLAVGNQMTVDVQLELGTLEETVTVAGESPIIDVTSKEIGGNISTKELSDIPSIARNFTYFAGLLPGIVPTANLASWGSDTLTANGVDSRNNSYLVDGAWDNDDYLGQNNGAQARVPLDAAQEFQVLTGPVRRRVRPHLGRDRQCGDQIGHQHDSWQRLRVLLQPGSAGEGFFPGAEQPGQGRYPQARVRRLDWRADCERQAAFLCGLRARTVERGTNDPDSGAAGSELHDRH